MRWESSGVRWVRPIRSILCLLDGAVVRFRFGAVESGATTRGHRVLSPGVLHIDAASGYAASLEKARVMLTIPRRAPARSPRVPRGWRGRNVSRSSRMDWLVSENAGLVEWPVVLMGSIDTRFMGLPAEVLTSAMRTHQRYFNLLTRDGQLAPRFIMVADTETADDGAAVVAGNERVLRARLGRRRVLLQP